MWEAFQHAGWEGLDNLVAIIDVNRLGQTRETMLGWDLAGYANRDPRRSAGTRSRSTATTWTRSRPPTRGRGDHGQADRDHRPHEEGQGREGGRGPARQARQAARRPRRRDRGARRLPRPDGRGRQARARRAEHVRDRPAASCRPGTSASRSPRARPTARCSRRSARSTARSSRSTARSPTRRTRRTSARRTRTATSRCSSRSSSSCRPRSGCRSAGAGSRSPRRSRRSSRGRTTSSAWRRSAART